MRSCEAAVSLQPFPRAFLLQLREFHRCQDELAVMHTYSYSKLNLSDYDACKALIFVARVSLELALILAHC